MLLRRLLVRGFTTFTAPDTAVVCASTAWSAVGIDNTYRLQDALSEMGIVSPTPVQVLLSVVIAVQHAFFVYLFMVDCRLVRFQGACHSRGVIRRSHHSHAVRRSNRCVLRVLTLLNIEKQSVCMRLKDWPCRAQVIPARSPCQAYVAFVPMLALRTHAVVTVTKNNQVVSAPQVCPCASCTWQFSMNLTACTAGSGKSLAFLLPLIQRLKHDEVQHGVATRCVHPFVARWCHCGVMIVVCWLVTDQIGHGRWCFVPAGN
jgi:hypothetical protein